MAPIIRKILYATDLGSHARSGFAHAVKLAQSFGARIDVLHVNEPPVGYPEGVLSLYVSDASQKEQRAEALARTEQEIRERVRRYCETEGCKDPDGGDWLSAIRVTEGPAAAEILRYARESGADIIVMGSHGKRAVTEILLGSTAHQVLQKAEVPVLLVRSE